MMQHRGTDDAAAIVNMAKEQSRTMPVFIMLASRTCGYCEDLSTMFTRVSQQLAIPIKVLKVDIDEFPAIKAGMRFRRATPDTHAYQNGTEAYSFLGALPYENMVSGLKSMSAAISKGPHRGP
jgi:thioredoxin-like negative regulator of GroEL